MKSTFPTPTHTSNSSGSRTLLRTGLARSRPTACRGVFSCTALVLALGLFVAGCERAEIRPITSGARLEGEAGSVVAFHLMPSYFETISMALPAQSRARFGLVWEGGAIEELLEDGTTLVIGPLDVAFPLESLALLPEDGTLDVSIRYSAQSVRTVVRISQQGNFHICRVDLGLASRELKFDMVPMSGTLPSWATELRTFSPESPTTYGMPAGETCTFDLDGVDWAFVDARLEKALDKQARETFVPALQALIVNELALPQGGFLLLPLQKGFFEPQTVQLATQVAELPPWTGSGFEIGAESGLKLALDVAVKGPTADCMASVDGLFTAIPTPLSATDAPRLTAMGEPYDVLIQIDRGFFNQMLETATASGYFCVDLPIGAQTRLTTLNALAPRLGLMDQFSFASEGRLRLQPLSALSLQSIEAGELRWGLPRVRLELYGDSEGLLIEVADIVSGLDIGTLPSVRDGLLSFEVAKANVDVESANYGVLEKVGTAIQGDTLVEDLVTAVVQRLIHLAVPVPFGFSTPIVEMEEREGAVWVYLSLE
ncbi:MAG: hypothetical protein COW42_03435 [Deltaproteobacteria bacterium CG17_big_fil_post_rev_8_21_14_2_50_63_7]|nr:MAG: hypothetical protein COW42_03435 [Deltaproteobacteria bacterium CG17_big_fil_post_rev_8_21_14_2_50_63_7]